MNLAELKARGALISTVPVRKTVEWESVDPESGNLTLFTFDVHVKRFSFGQVERLAFSKIHSSDRSTNAEVISTALLLGEAPFESMTYEEAYSLDPKLAAKFIEAISSVNRVESLEKKSPPPTSSGTN